jgi:hypothetical protein
LILRAFNPKIRKIPKIKRPLILSRSTSCAAKEIKHTPTEASGPGDEMSTSVFGGVDGVGGVDGIGAALGLITVD